LQTLSFVEVFPDRGHNLHELTRQTLLHQLWEPERPTFLTLSQRLADSFAPDATHQADWIYHLAIANPQQARQEFDRYARHLDHNYRRSESETLFAGLTEHRAAGRLDQRLVGDLAYWEGRLHFRFYEPQIALERYETAIAIYREVGARLGEANTLQAIGDVLQFLDQRTAALERYETAIAIYREVGARLGEANTLQAIGDLQSDPSLAMEQFLQPALVIYQGIEDVYSQGRILADSIAPTYLKLKQPYQAKLSYEQALQLWSQIGYERGIQQCQNALRNISGTPPRWLRWLMWFLVGVALVFLIARLL
jgi:tetratricopeptide (TPR) repeat protein